MVKTSMDIQGSRKQQILKQLATFTVQLLITGFLQIATNISVYADDIPSDLPAGSINIGSETVTDNGIYELNGGYHQVDGGYRIYMENKSGQIVQQVVDLLLNDLPNTDGNYIYKMQSTSLGGLGLQDEIKELKYSKISNDVPDLFQPYYNGQAWGEELNQWCEVYGSLDKTMPNAEALIYAVFKTVGDDAETYLGKYLDGEYRLVIEALYWFRPISHAKQHLYKDGKVYWLYGTVKDIAKTLRDDLSSLVSKTGRPYGGVWLGILTNGNFATALKLIETDEYSGFGPPVGGNTVNSGEGPYSYDEILAPKQGWGMHVVYREKVEEQWATYDASAYGGSIGDSPGSAPEMPSITTTTTSWRKVSIVKFYEEAVKQSNGMTVYRTVSGPYKRDQICRTIEVQNEPGWTLKGYAIQKGYHGWKTWEQTKGNRLWMGYSPAKVEVDTDRINQLKARLFYMNSVLFVLFKKNCRSVDNLVC